MRLDKPIVLKIILMIVPKSKQAESFEHLRIKEFFYENIPLDNKVEVIKKEYPIGNRKADIYCKLVNGKEIVVEIQHSMILTKDLLQRTKEYNELNCHVLWVFNGSSFERYPKIEDNIHYMSFEKCSQMLYRGRVYYINMTKYGIHSPVYPLHFASYYERKSSNYRFQYYRKSPIKKTIVPGTIPSLYFKTFKNKGYKLAGFYDENIRKRCIEEIGQLLNDYKSLEKELNDIEKLNPHQKKIFIIMATCIPRYGLHLIYNVLLYLKAVTKADFRYMRIINQYMNNTH